MGSLHDYYFAPRGGAPPKSDPTLLGKVNRNGILVTTPPVEIPGESAHETEPWGDPGCVWPVRARWNREWEQKYSNWISGEVTPSYLAENGIPVDCADAPYALRWIFARSNFLPQGAHNSYGAIFGNWNVRFADLPTSTSWPQDRRFMAALNYVMETHIQGRSIPYDTYPIRLFPQSGALRPGTVVADKTHVRIISRIDPTATRPIRNYSSTLPAKIRLLADETLSDAIENSGAGWGIVNWSWWDYDFSRHRYLCVPDEAMPGYSVEQYSMFDDEIRAGLLHEAYRGADVRHTPPDPRMAMEEMLRDVAEALRVRQELVQEGWTYYSQRPGDRDKKSLAYDNFSTPNRDGRLRRLLEELRGQAVEGGIQAEEVAHRLEQTPIPVLEGQPTTLLIFAEALEKGRTSSEPWDPPYRRWGTTKP